MIVDQMGRITDVVIAGTLLVITLPLMLFVALALKWESPSPVLCRHHYIGCGGRRFRILEFRTTAPDSEPIASAWPAQRLSRVGTFLRLTRIDALPQLINVLRGEMSLVERDGRAPSFLD